jgi:heme-degrading monooxygenase HmoA
MHIVLFHIRTRPDLDEAAYEQAFEEMMAAVSTMPGFVSIGGFAGDDGSELAVVRFESEDAIRAWRNHPDHVRTRDRGREEFFDSYEITVAEVTRAYEWRHGEPAPTFAVSEDSVRVSGP